MTDEEIERLRESLSVTTSITVNEVSRVLAALDALADARRQLAEARQRVERQADWYQQRFNRLRRWVKEEVEPLSAEVAHRYFAIVANGSPAPHESADWSGTLHAMTLRAEVAERQLATARHEGEAAGRAAAFTETLEHVRRESKGHTEGDNEGGALALDILANWLVEKVGAGEESGR